VKIHQDAYLYATLLDGAERVVHALAPGRKGYVHVARGQVTANGQPLAAGDALKATDVPEIILESGAGAEVLVFDLP
jgi:redox-sensitive bicupin YhaK (pirin superfamily)